MPVQTKLSTQKIIDKEFPCKKPGYDALEVDKFLDEIVDDYMALQNYIKDLEVNYDELKKTAKLYKGRLDDLEIKNAVMNDKLENIGNNEAASLSNLDLLKRISALEQALFKAGIDPSTIK